MEYVVVNGAEMCYCQLHTKESAALGGGECWA